MIFNLHTSISAQYDWFNFCDQQNWIVLTCIKEGDGEIFKQKIEILIQYFWASGQKQFNSSSKKILLFVEPFGNWLTANAPGLGSK